MGIWYKYNNAAARVYPFYSVNGEPVNLIAWKPNKDKPCWPTGAIHLFTFNHGSVNCVNSCCKYGISRNKPDTNVECYISACPNNLKMKWENGDSTYYSTDYTSKQLYIPNPGFFIENDNKGNIRCCGNQFARSWDRPLEIWSYRWRWADSTSPAADWDNSLWYYSTDTYNPSSNHAKKIGLIWPNSGRGQDGQKPRRNDVYTDPATARPDKLVYGFVPALMNTNIWPTHTRCMLTFASILKVPTSNTAHSISMYYKGSTKSQLGEWCWAKEGSHDPLEVKPEYTYNNNTKDYFNRYYYGKYYNSNAFRQVFSSFIKTSNLEDGKWKSNGHLKQIMNNGSYRYIFVKGWAPITSANTDIFTPAGIAYRGFPADSGPKTPTITDSWISMEFQTT